MLNSRSVLRVFLAGVENDSSRVEVGLRICCLIPRIGDSNQISLPEESNPLSLYQLMWEGWDTLVLFDKPRICWNTRSYRGILIFWLSLLGGYLGGGRWKLMVNKPIRSGPFGAICDILRTKAQKIRKNAAMCVFLRTCRPELEVSEKLRVPQLIRLQITVGIMEEYFYLQT